MLRYIIIRLLLILPTLFIICAISFFLFQLSGSDPVDGLLSVRGLRSSDERSIDYEQEYRAAASELGTDQPLFYISLVPHYYPDTLHRISFPKEAELARDLLQEYREWDKIQAYMLALRAFTREVAQSGVSALYDAYHGIIKASELSAANRDVSLAVRSRPELVLSHAAVLEAQHAMTYVPAQSWFYPSIRLHGYKNQFHQWVSSLLRGDFGRSMIDGRPITTKIIKALNWSIALGLIAVIMSSFIALPFGFYAAYYHGSLFDRFGFLLLYVIYSIPVFWMATMLIVFFTSDDFGRWTDIFPGVGTFYDGRSQGVLGQMWTNLEKLVLPLFCLVIHSLAYMGRQMRSSVLNEKDQAYYKTAISKGLTQFAAMRRHVLPNSLLPIFTIIIARIPAAIAGSLVIEVIFNIPGMGRLLYTSIYSDDWNTISAILIIISLSTMIIYLIGDLIYQKIDPRIKYKLR